MVVVAGARIVLGDRLLDPGWVAFDGVRLTAVGGGHPAGRVDHHLPGRLVVPGFVDMHVHGGNGSSYDTGDLAEAEAVAAFHRRHGTTTTLASLVTAPVDALERRVADLADLVESGSLAGLHLEGPWLSPRRAGAHDPALLRAPELSQVRRVLGAGRGHVRMVTLAPELEGGLAAVRAIVDAGVVVALGHTDATYDLTRRALDAGATVGTHLFNAMSSLHHREPGPVVALLEDPRATVELIADGVHVHPAVLRFALARAGPGRVALVTDAMAGAGAPDGRYRLGGLEVQVVEGVARVGGAAEGAAEGPGTIAGSTLTMDAAFRFLIRHCGASPVAAAIATATTPAAVLGLDDVGMLAAGRRADLVVLDGSLQVEAVLRAGAWVSGPPDGVISGSG